MRVAVIGSRSPIVQDLGSYLPKDTTLIISGGAKGIDTRAKEYALSHGVHYVEFLPDYNHYGKSAPLKRNYHSFMPPKRDSYPYIHAGRYSPAPCASIHSINSPYPMVGSLTNTWVRP